MESELDLVIAMNNLEAERYIEPENRDLEVEEARLSESLANEEDNGIEAAREEGRL